MFRRVYRVMFLATLAFAQSASAKRFTNSYCSFWVPDDWKCERDGTETICRPRFEESGSKEVVLILTAKVPGPTDSFGQFIDHLQKDPDGAGPAKVTKKPRLIKLGGRDWVDATIDGAEIPGYSTRYLATVDETVSILFTASLFNESADDFADIVEQIAASVRARKLDLR